MELLTSLGKTGALLSSGPWLHLIGYAQTTLPAAASRMTFKKSKSEAARRTAAAGETGHEDVMASTVKM